MAPAPRQMEHRVAEPHANAATGGVRLPGSGGVRSVARAVGFWVMSHACSARGAGGGGYVLLHTDKPLHSFTTQIRGVKNPQPRGSTSGGWPRQVAS